MAILVHNGTSMASRKPKMLGVKSLRGGKKEDRSGGSPKLLDTRPGMIMGLRNASPTA